MSSASESEHSGEGEWMDMESDHETITITSLFTNQTFPSAKAMLDDCKKSHNFDFLAAARSLNLDFHGAVKLVNFIRAHVRDGKPLPSLITAKDLEDDQYLKPVLENDALLFEMDEVLEEGEAGEGEGKSKKELEEELESLRNQFASYRLTVEETLEKRWGDDTVVAPQEKKSNANYYFESYAEHEIHETMLKDKIRTDAYRDFIYENKHIFKGKVVLDIGCGTGILSMFAARAGAKKVIAVDKSDIIAKATENIFNNGLSDVITCVKGAIEEVVLPVDSVDIIVSEWMGYCLLYEAMLNSVLYARDRYLKPDGILAPSSATIWMAPVADPEYVADNITFWRDIYGFDMKAMMTGIYEECRVNTMPEKCLAGKPHPFRVIDLHTVKVDELQFTTNWTSEITRDIDELDGFLIWFDNFFATARDQPMPADNCTPDQWVKQKEGNVAFTTGPQGTETHWRQGLLLTPPEDKTGKVSAGTSISGDIQFKAADDNPRALELNVNWTLGDKDAKKRSWQLK